MRRAARSLKPPSYTGLLTRAVTPTEWEIARAWTYIGGRECITVPEGFRFDGASVPRALRWFAQPMEPRLLAAALLHDFLYRTRPLLNDGMTQRVTSRADADRLFLRVLLEDGEHVLRAWLLFASVRAFGWIAWRRRAPMEVA